MERKQFSSKRFQKAICYFQKGFVTKLTSLVQLYSPRRRADVFLHAIIQVIVIRVVPSQTAEEISEIVQRGTSLVVLSVVSVVLVLFLSVSRLYVGPQPCTFLFLRVVVLHFQLMMSLWLYSPFPFYYMNEMRFPFCLQQLICNYDTDTSPTP